MNINYLFQHKSAGLFIVSNVKYSIGQLTIKKSTVNSELY